MRKSLIAATIVGLAALGSAHASEVNQDMQFMTDHDMRDVSGARLAPGVSAQSLRLFTQFRYNQYKLNGNNKKKLMNTANELIRSKKLYSTEDFKYIINQSALGYRELENGRRITATGYFFRATYRKGK